MTSFWADSGNRTRVFSLAKRNFTIRLYPLFVSFLIHNMSIIHNMSTHIWYICLEHICAVLGQRLSSDWSPKFLLIWILYSFFFSFKNKKFDPLLIFHFFLIFIWILGTYIECVSQPRIIQGGHFGFGSRTIGSRDERIKDTHQKD